MLIAIHIYASIKHEDTAGKSENYRIFNHCIILIIQISNIENY